MNRASFLALFGTTARERSRTGLALVAAAIGVAALPAGCGVSTDATALFGSGATSGAGGNGTSSTTGATTSGTTGTTGEGGASTTSTGTTTTGDGGGSTTSTSTTGTTTTSSSTGGATLVCGDVDCPQGGLNACCWDNYQLNGAPQGQCVMGSPDNDGCITQAAANAGFETRIECQVPSQCAPGQVCCGDRQTYGGGGQPQVTWYASLTCVSDCPWPDVELCEPGVTPCPIVDLNGVPTQLICKPSQLLPSGYFVCGTP